MAIYIGSPSEAWRALTNVAADTQEVTHDRAKREFEPFEIGVSELVAEYYARVHFVLTKLTRHQDTTPAREIKCRVLSGLTPHFPDDVCVYTTKCDFDLKDL